MRFIPYLQQYEFEARLFAAPVHQCGSPELVNDNVATSPSHRMKALFPRYDRSCMGRKLSSWPGYAPFARSAPASMAGSPCLELPGTRPSS
ncbi:DUF4276 family protein [Massilia pseudoviolaceinigra]|uniref:DUF4276 family protein n=1 Tax=Massilia pseudoviolaceinigra TaxID=3057165 RepID=UPI0035B51F60